MTEEIKKQVFSSKLVKDIEKTINRFEMLQNGDRVIISVSGGPDSTFLTYLLDYLKPKFNLTLLAFHLDHMTRNGQSTRDAAFVEGLCQSLGIELAAERVDVKKWCRQNKFTFQEGARNLRVKMLMEISEKYNATKIATGHDADDNVETFLIHLIRGTGIKGLCGIPPKAGKFIRPLICAFRKDIITFLEENKIPYCVDKTNLENIYFRNKIRNILIPLVEKDFSKAFKKNLLKVIEVIREENRFLDEFSKKKFDEIALDFKSLNEEHEERIRPISVRLPLKELRELPLAVKRRVLLLGIEKAKGDLEDINFENIEDIIRVCMANIGGEIKMVDISDEIKAVRESGYINIVNTSDVEASKIKEFEWLVGDSGGKIKEAKKEGKKEEKPSLEESTKEEELEIGKKVSHKRFGIEVYSKVIDAKDASKEELNIGSIINTEAFLDYDKIKFPIKIRSWKKGDRFYPLGMKNEKKLQDFFVDCKIPRYLRKKIPIFVDGEKIVWIGKYRIDERVKITPSTRKVLYLKIEDEWCEEKHG